MFESLADRFFASDPGLSRLRFAGRTVLAVALAVTALAASGLPKTVVLFGTVCALFSSTTLRTGTNRERALNLVLLAPVIAASLSAATLLVGNLILGDIAFLVVMFLAVYIRRFGPLGLSLGMGAFIAFFFTLFLKPSLPLLPVLYIAIGAGLASSALMALLVLRDTPANTLRRTSKSIRAQVARLIEELAELLESGETYNPDDGGLPRPVARQTTRMHETTLQIEDNAEDLGVAARWRRQLVDAELAADRLARATVRALGAELDQPTRAKLTEDLRGLHRFVDRDPRAALDIDTDELLLRIARYDIRGDPSRRPSEPAHHTQLVHRAIRELLLSVVQLRRTMLRALDSPTGRDEEAGEEAEETAPSEPTEDLQAPGELRHTTRSAIQAVIGGALAIVGGELLSTQRWYWAVIAGFVVFAGTNSRGDLLVKGLRRVWGTLAGVVAGTVLATLLSGDYTLDLVTLLVCIFLAFYSLRVSYGLMTFFITLMLGMLYDILGVFSASVLVLRLAETALGVAASVLAAMLVLPARTRTTVQRRVHEYYTALQEQLREALRLLVYREQVDLIVATREVDRAAAEVCKAIDPMTHRMSPARVRRGSASRLRTLTEESAYCARNLARAAEPGALAGLPAAIRTLHRLTDNAGALVAATDEPPAAQELESGPALAPQVDVRSAAAANTAGAPDREHVLHLRRTVNYLDRLDELLLGMAGPLRMTVSIPEERKPQDTHAAGG